MQIRHIRYGHTVNLGNYESKRFEVELELGPHDTFDEALTLCKGLTGAALEQLDDAETDDLVERMDRAGVL